MRAVHVVGGGPAGGQARPARLPGPRPISLSRYPALRVEDRSMIDAMDAGVSLDAVDNWFALTSVVQCPICAGHLVLWALQSAGHRLSG
jgi:hypothetical protein